MAKWTLIAVLVAAALWSGWWVVGARMTEAAALDTVAEAEARGWDVAFDDLSVGGFPNRFDVTMTEARLTAPAGWTLSAPILRAFALAYRPTHVIAVAPPRMTLSGGAMGEVAILSDDLRASVVATVATAPLLDRATATVEGLRLEGQGWTASLASGQVATRQADGPSVHDLAIRLSDLTIGEETIGAAEVDATVALDRALALGDGDPARLDALDLRRATLDWGGAGLDLAGDVRVGPDGLPRGDLRLVVTGWEAALDRAVEAGAMVDGRARLIAAGLAGLGDGEGRAVIPVVLADGVARVMGFPLAPLPRLPVPGR
jgi:hypothetical protein